MADVQAENVCVSFLITGDLNGYKWKWLSSGTHQRHHVAASRCCGDGFCNSLVFISWILAQPMSSNYSQHSDTDIHGLIQVTVSRMGNSDHSTLLVVITMAQTDTVPS